MYEKSPRNLVTCIMNQVLTTSKFHYPNFKFKEIFLFTWVDLKTSWNEIFENQMKHTLILASRNSQIPLCSIFGAPTKNQDEKCRQKFPPSLIKAEIITNG